MRRAIIAGLLLGLSALPCTGGEVRLIEGHGGPVMGLEVSPDGARVLSASFDYSIGLHAIAGGAPIWLEGHRAAVNAAVFLGEGRAVSAGDDGEIILWDLTDGTELRRMTGHTGKVRAVAVSPDTRLIASAGWDGRVGLWNAQDGTRLRWIEGHGGRVNDVRFSADGTALYSASDDGTIRSWDVGDGSLLRLETDHGFGVNRLAVDPQARWLAYGAVDGRVRVSELATGRTVADLMLDRGPVLALVLRPDGRVLAVGYGDGQVMFLETAGWSVVRAFEASHSGPVWALAFAADGALLSGGVESAIAVWPAQGGAAARDPTSQPFHRESGDMPNGERQFVRKCSICHSLGEEPDRRAGPPLGGLFGRRAGTFAGYAYSEVLDGAELVWSEATVDALFRLGPDRVVPGSKMPLQRITSETDRKDLVAYLKSATERGSPVRE